MYEEIMNINLRHEHTNKPRRRNSLSELTGRIRSISDSRRASLQSMTTRPLKNKFVNQSNKGNDSFPARSASLHGTHSQATRCNISSTSYVELTKLQNTENRTDSNSCNYWIRHSSLQKTAPTFATGEDIRSTACDVGAIASSKMTKIVEKFQRAVSEICSDSRRGDHASPSNED